MRRFNDALQSIAATLWLGGMWVSGFAVAPLLFAVLPDRALAGMIAGKLFTMMAWIGVACAACLLSLRLLRHRGQVLRQPVFRVALLMLALVCAGEFAIQPVLAGLKAQALPVPVMESTLRASFAAWHGVSGVIYLIQSVLGAALIILLGREKDRQDG